MRTLPSISGYSDYCPRKSMKTFTSKPNRNHTKNNQNSITYKTPFILPLEATQM